MHVRDNLQFAGWLPYI